jgi:1-acyl-sn-glycerol-3-phosphate acyltransferase
MIETTRRVQRVLADGWVIVIAGEGRIHRGERLLPLADGRPTSPPARVPIVPIAINGTSWLGVRRPVRIRSAHHRRRGPGEPGPWTPDGPHGRRPSAMVADYPIPSRAVSAAG